MTNDYELYKGNQLVTWGTIKDIAEELGIKERTVYFYGTPSYMKRNPGENSYRLYKIEKTPIYKYNRYGKIYKGTVKEIAEQTGLKEHTLVTYASTGKLKYIGEC